MPTLISSQTGTYILMLPRPTGTASLCYPPTSVMGWWTTPALYSIYSHQKSEFFLLTYNRLTCLQWMSHILYIFYLGAGRASSLITPTDNMQRDLWPWPRRLIASASAVPPSGNEAHSRNPIRSTQSSNHKCCYLQIDIAVQNPDVLSVCCLLEMNQHLSSYYPPPTPHASVERSYTLLPLPLLFVRHGQANHASHSVCALRGLGKWLNHTPFSSLFSCLC